MSIYPEIPEVEIDKVQVKLAKELAFVSDLEDGKIDSLHFILVEEEGLVPSAVPRLGADTYRKYIERIMSEEVLTVIRGETSSSSF